jgi:hypothetical protein
MRRPALLALLIAFALTAVASGPAQADTSPTNATAPALSGSKLIGSTLTATTGTWNGTTPMTYSYRWYRCAADATNYLACSTINVAWSSSNTYTTTALDTARRILVEVRATNGAGSGYAYAPAPYGPHASA